MYRFVLGGSGHVAGIVNTPAANKYHYWTNEALPSTAEQGFEDAEQHEGSWWSDWQAWIEGQNAGEKVPARLPGDHELKVIEDAPGSYAIASPEGQASRIGGPLSDFRAECRATPISAENLRPLWLRTC